MGLLSEGKPLSWAETKKHADLVRRVGIQQFLSLYHRLQNRKDVLKWGDEVGGRVTCWCHVLLLKQVEMQEEANLELRDREDGCVFHPPLVFYLHCSALREIRENSTKRDTSMGQTLRCLA